LPVPTQWRPVRKETWAPFGYLLRAVSAAQPLGHRVGTKALQQYPAIETHPPTTSFWIPAGKNGFG